MESSRSLDSPAFGQADLSNCELEQIHLAGSIQPHGALLIVREPDNVVVQASANAASFLNLDAVLGKSLADLDGDLLLSILPHLNDSLHTVPRAVRCRIGKPVQEFDGLLHRPAAGGLVIELEHAGSAVDLARHVERGLARIINASSLRNLCDETARVFKELSDYDRVMVYRFDEEGHGEVFSEEREPRLEAFLGNHYPATDIPQIARRLYEKNRVRVLVDVDAEIIPLFPRVSPLTGADVDMSMCFLRSMSPIHVQYLKNMGVSATLVVSLLVGGRLWGLIACHHYSARFVHFEVRAVCELLAEAIGTRIAALESFLRGQGELFVRRLELRMIKAITHHGDWRIALFDPAQPILSAVGATGAALVYQGQVQTTGEVPGTQQVRDIAAWLDAGRRSAVIASATLGSQEPAFLPIKSVAAGILATPITNSRGDYLIWFRPEQVRTVTWGGDPLKPMLIGANPSDLSPRRSFAQWHQLVEATCEPWTPTDHSAARLIGEAVSDVILQFRSVQMLIAQTQLEQVSREVRISDQPVVIVDAAGNLLLTSEAFKDLLPPTHRAMKQIEELPAFFDDKGEFQSILDDLLNGHRAWRGEVRLIRENEMDATTLLLRADPVWSSPENLLGFVLLFTDMSDRKAAEVARRKFQEGLLERRRITTIRLDSSSDITFQGLLSSLIENAQLAALEITHSSEVASMPEMLEAVRVSVTRTAELLEQLIWHACRTSE